MLCFMYPNSGLAERFCSLISVPNNLSVCILTIGNALLSKKSKLQLARGTMEPSSGDRSVLIDARFLLNFNVFKVQMLKLFP